MRTVDLLRARLQRAVDRRHELRGMMIGQLWSQLASNRELGESRPTHEVEFSQLTWEIERLKRQLEALHVDQDR